MARAHPPAAKAAKAVTATSYLPNPLEPLARQVGEAVATKVCEPAASYAVKAPAKQARKAPPKAPAADANALQTKLGALIAEELVRSLSAPTAAGRELRMALIARLASAELGADAAHEGAAALASDALLTTAEAAAKLDVSRPYVSMLCDQGKLGEIALTEGGHRRIRSSAVEAYLNGRTRQHANAQSPREAGMEAGLYDYPEGHFANVARSSPGAGRQQKSRSKGARKSRS